MDDYADFVTPALERLAPALEAIFLAYQVPEARQREIVEEARRIVTVKWPRLRQPDTWLLRWIVERCRTREENELEEASD
ncbi:MAG TPA: hypothetical protein VN493_14390 [Thermoanaerobaculia bacterium]|nr:hypothetical protein [Thermoanaerobaculia bacterium]